MTLFSHFAEARSRFGQHRRTPAADRSAAPQRRNPAATLSQAELQREIIALIG